MQRRQRFEEDLKVAARERAGDLGIDIVCHFQHFIAIGFAGFGEKNADSAPVISPEGGRVTVRVVRTDEELMMARSVKRLLALDEPSGRAGT